MKMLKNTSWLLVSLFLVQGCTPSMSFKTSTALPAASGTVQTKQDKNKNYVVQVSLRNLAEPKNLDPSRKTYVVWMETDDNTVQKLGQLTPYSKQLKADLKATTTVKPKQVFLTAEDDAQVMQPTGSALLATDNRQR